MPGIIPSVGLLQLGLINELCNTMTGHLVWVKEDIEKDEPNAYARHIEINTALNELSGLELIEDITKFDILRPLMEDLKKTGREFRIFRASSMGQLLFNETQNTSKWKN